MGVINKRRRNRKDQVSFTEDLSNNPLKFSYDFKGSKLKAKMESSRSNHNSALQMTHVNSPKFRGRQVLNNLTPNVRYFKISPRAAESVEEKGEESEEEVKEQKVSPSPLIKNNLADLLKTNFSKILKKPSLPAEPDDYVNMDGTLGLVPLTGKDRFMMKGVDKTLARLDKIISQKDCEGSFNQYENKVKISKSLKHKPKIHVSRNSSQMDINSLARLSSQGEAANSCKNSPMKLEEKQMARSREVCKVEEIALKYMYSIYGKDERFTVDEYQ